MLKRSTSVLFAAVCALCLLVSVGGAQSAFAVAEGTGWEAFSSAFPTNLPPGGSGRIQVHIVNVGAKPSEGSITVTDTLPPGVTATTAGGMGAVGTSILSLKEEEGEFGGARWICSGTTVVTCTSNPSFLPHLPVGSGSELQLVERLGIAVKVEEGVSGTFQNRVTISGGGASEARSVS